MVQQCAHVQLCQLHRVEDLVLDHEGVEAAVQQQVGEEEEGVVLDPSELEDLEDFRGIDNILLWRDIDDELYVDVLCVGGAANSTLQVQLVVEVSGLVASAAVVAVGKERAQTLLGEMVKQTIVIEIADASLLLDYTLLNKV